MKITTRFIVVAIATPGIRAAARPVDVATFLKGRGAEDAGLKPIARSPDPAIVPVSLYEKDNPVPSCCVLETYRGFHFLVDDTGAHAHSKAYDWHAPPR